MPVRGSRCPLAKRCTVKLYSPTLIRRIPRRRQRRWRRLSRTLLATARSASNRRWDGIVRRGRRQRRSVRIPRPLESTGGCHHRWAENFFQIFQTRFVSFDFWSTTSMNLTKKLEILSCRHFEMLRFAFLIFYILWFGFIPWRFRMITQTNYLILTIHVKARRKKRRQVLSH